MHFWFETAFRALRTNSGVLRSLAATNLKLLALIKGLHNNHHARPASAKLSAFRGEIDPAWPVIRLLEKLRLARALSKVDEGWENHRRRIPTTTVSPTGRVLVKD